jgi:hypothetical protein
MSWIISQARKGRAGAYLEVGRVSRPARDVHVPQLKAKLSSADTSEWHEDKRSINLAFKDYLGNKPLRRGFDSEREAFCTEYCG